MRAGSINLGNTCVQMLLKVIGVDEITQLVRKDSEEERLGREKDPAEEPEKRPVKKGKAKRVDT